jgi:hypothetical protein
MYVGWLSSYILNRTARWATHFTHENNFKLNPDKFTEDEIKPFLDDPRLVMLLVNQHHNVSNHPKVLSIPLGVLDPKLIWSTLSRVIRKSLPQNKIINTAGSNWYYSYTVYTFMYPYRVHVYVTMTVGVQDLIFVNVSKTT